MKSFKALMFLTLAATLSCGANGSPTNITTDDYPKKPSPEVLKGIMDGLQGLANLYFKAYGDNHAKFIKEYVDRLAWVRPYNYVICDVSVPHVYIFDGKKGVNWDHKNIAKPGQQPAIVYEVVVGGSGTFARKGQGGYEKWGWNGFVAKNQDMASNALTFVKPLTGRQAEGGGN